MNLDVYIFVKNEVDLTEDKKAFMVIHAYGMASIPKIRTALVTKF